ncbi:hypothetical protein Tco_1253787 [Tanacetum coccineum]
MADVGDLDEIEEVNAKCILMANLQQASTSDTQTDNALIYDSDGSAEVVYNDNCYNNEIFNMFTQEEQYAELLEPILEPHQEAAKFIRDFQSLANEADESLAKHKALELEIERLLRVVNVRNYSFRINPYKNSMEVKYVPNKPIKASVRTNPITVPQPHVITKKAANSNSNGFSSTGVDIATKTRRP